MHAWRNACSAAPCQDEETLWQSYTPLSVAATAMAASLSSCAASGCWEQLDHRPHHHEAQLCPCALLWQGGLQPCSFRMEWQQHSRVLGAGACPSVGDTFLICIAQPGQWEPTRLQTTMHHHEVYLQTSEAASHD